MWAHTPRRALERSAADTETPRLSPLNDYVYVRQATLTRTRALDTYPVGQFNLSAGLGYVIAKVARPSTLAALMNDLLTAEEDPNVNDAEHMAAERAIAELRPVLDANVGEEAGWKMARRSRR